jgi:hypothetical protein
VRLAIYLKLTELIPESGMMHSMAELNTCTEEELQEVLAGILAHARGEVLNDTEVQQFWQVYEEIQRRSASLLRLTRTVTV